MKFSGNKTRIKFFLGLVQYYQRFVPKLAGLAVPLQKMLKKDRKPKDWGQEQEDAVRDIKE